MVPPVKPIATIDPFSVENGGDVVPSLPAELITSPLNTVAMSGDCRRTDHDFMGVARVFKNFVIPKIIIPIGTGGMPRITCTVSVAGVVAPVIGGPHIKSILNLFQVVFTLHFVGFSFGLSEGGEQHGRQDANNGNYH